METKSVVGLDDAIEAAASYQPDVVICDYDLLATIPLEGWERDPLLSRLPVIAVSLTRRPEEVHLMDVNGIAGLAVPAALEPSGAADAERRGVVAPSGRGRASIVAVPGLALGTHSIVT